MFGYENYLYINRSYNFKNLPDNDAVDNLIYPKTADGSGYYTINYETPATSSILLLTDYYTTGDEEYLYFRALGTA